VHAPPAEAPQDLVVAHVDVHHEIDLDSGAAQCLGLRNGAGKAVEDEAACAIRLRQALLDDADHDVVGDQSAAVDVGSRLQSERRTVLDRGAQHVAGGDLRDSVLLRKEARLRALAGAGHAQKYYSHGIFTGGDRAM